MSWLFVHPPRTGGTAIVRMWGGRGPGYPFAVEEHHSSAFLRDRIGEKWDELYVFGTARNPYDRAVSLAAFEHGCEERDDPLTREEFRAWVLSGERGMRVGNTIEPGKGSHPSPLYLADPQMLFLCTGFFVHVVRYESRAADLDVATRGNGLLADPALKARVTNRERRWEHYYDDDLREMVGMRYDVDFDGLGYKR